MSIARQVSTITDEQEEKSLKSRLGWVSAAPIEHLESHLLQSNH